MAYELNKLKILLVDDDSSMRFLVWDVLKAFGVGDIQPGLPRWITKLMTCLGDFAIRINAIHTS